jgi:hypothetical protein
MGPVLRKLTVCRKTSCKTNTTQSDDRPGQRHLTVLSKEKRMRKKRKDWSVWSSKEKATELR